ncbi:hypothetical protein [Legionella gresilensis]|uniref:hypothetical protein n=1 Tax=Legionella gresilensis TaxID=91823 RepID=UPI00104106E8|nr:hypothetical protein [Legionella gresilensis]
MNNAADISHVLYLSSCIEVTKCQECSELFNSKGRKADMDEQINHYLQKHEYKILHIGAETDNSSNGGLWHSTVAMLGR